MADSERESLDDFEIEITDLDPTLNRGTRRRLRLTPRRRRWSAVATVVVFVLLIGLFLGSISDVRGLLARTIFRPAPPVPANALAVYLQGNPSWGQFSIDGNPLAHQPVVGRDTPLALHFGSHTITWQIAPLQPQRCVFAVVDTTTIKGPCLHNGEVNASFVVNGQDVLLSFFASANDLSSEEHAALIQQLQTTMAAYGGSELVRPGELYTVSEQQAAANPALCTVATRVSICMARAAQPLQATLSVQLDSSTSPTDPCALSEQCFMNGQDCRAICSDPFAAYDNAPVQGWNVAVVVNLSWSYTTLSGQVVARALPDSAIRGMESYQVVPVHLTPAGRGLHVVPFPDSYGVGVDNPLCDQAASDTDELVSSSAGNQEMFVQQVADLLGHGAAGCLVILKTSPNISLNPSTPISGANSSQVAYCLVRFGVVLAVNHFAHQSWPFLPLADDYENGLAQTLRATLPAST